MPRTTIVPAFTDEECRAILYGDPGVTFFTDQYHQIKYAVGRAETYVAAARWHCTVDELADLIRSEGPAHSYTSPSAFALSLWTKRLGPDRYSLRAGFAADLCHRALYGGRCEVYRYLENEPAHQYDITSAYPYAATQLAFPDPYSLRYAKPATEANIWMWEGVSRITFAQISPLGSFPILPVRWAGRVVYPNVEQWTGEYTHTEIRYALHHSPAIKLLSIDKQYIADQTLPTNPFSRFVEYCYERRVRTGRKVWKLVANALFGRLAVDGAGLWAFRPTTDYRTFRTLPSDSRGFFGVPCVGTVSTAPARGNVLWAAMVLAQARCALHSYCDPDTVYVDTDCLFCTQPRNLPISDTLGGWKYRYGTYQIRGTQAYQVTTPDGEVETKLRGVARATRKPADFFRAQTTAERIRLPDGRTVPLQIGVA